MYRLSLKIILAVVFTSCFNTETTHFNNGMHPLGFPIKGISMVAPIKQIDKASLQPIIKINANSISIMPYAFCSQENSEVRFNQHGQHWGENIDGVVGCIQLAHQNNISVMVKPHLWIGHGVYTGAFTLATEKEWQIWETSYLKYMLHFAVVADSMKAEIFCIGTELGTAIKHRPKFWSAFIDTLRKTFHSKLTYAANWDDYKNFPFWEKLDYIGIDAYFPLSTEKTPSINSLKNGWTKYIDELEKINETYKLPILFTEYGYRNVDYNCNEPWKENEGNQNDEAQANAMEAFYQSFASKKWFAGGFVWKWYLENGRHRRSEIDFSPQNKPAAKVIESWYRN